MKSCKILVAFILTVSLHSAQAQITNADTMMHRIFSTLKNKDEKAYVALYPNKEQMVKLMSKMMATIVSEIAKADTSNKKNVDEAELQKRVVEMLQEKTTPEQLDKEYARFAKKFSAIIKAGERKGIDWNNIQLTRYKLDTGLAKSKEAMKYFGEGEMKEMKGTLYFTSASEAFELDINEVIYLPGDGGWYGAGLSGLRKQGESEKQEVEVIDLQLSDTNVEMPPPLPSPPAKTKQKTKAKAIATKTKVKTKS